MVTLKKRIDKTIKKTSTNRYEVVIIPYLGDGCYDNPQTIKAFSLAMLISFANELRKQVLNDGKSIFNFYLIQGEQRRDLIKQVI